MKRFLLLAPLYLTLLFISTLAYSKKAAPAGSITPVGALTGLSTTYGTVSGETSFSFTASGLGALEVVTVTAPTGFEVSLTTGVGFAPSVTATANGGGNISSTNIFVRLTATASVAGSPYSGNITLIGASASANEATVSSTVSAKALTMSGLSVPGSKIYDGTTAASVSGSPALQASEAIGVGNSSDGKPYTGDVVSITGSAIGTYNSKDVSAATTVTFSGLTLGGAQGTNYSLTIQAAASATITTKALTVTGLSVPASKIYDGSTAAVVSGSASLQAAEATGAGSTGDGKPYTGDVVGITGSATGTYNSKDVLTATTVNYSGLSLTGAQLGNYSLTQGSPAATITPKALSMSGLSVPGSKIYDGTATAVVSGSPALVASEAVGAGTTADGIPYTGDAVSISGSAVGTYNSKDVLTATTVTYSGLSLGGAQSANYTLTIQAAAPATITTKALNMTGLSVPGSKIYDATTTAVVSGSPALLAAEAGGAGTTADGKPYTGDVVSITGSATGTYNSKDVSTATTVTYSGLSLTGAQNANYTLTIQSAAAATITTKNLTISGVSASNKVYDGTTAATLTGAAVLLASEVAGAGTTADGKPYTGDAVSITGSGVGTFTTAATSAGQAAVTVNVTGYTLGSAQASNYTPVQPAGLTANINAQEPTAQARNVSFPGGSVTASSFTINWQAPGGSPVVPGTNYLVVVNPGGTGSIGGTVPTDLINYTASSDLASPGSQITPGNYVVYNGTGTSVALTNLNPNTTYEVQVFLFNGGPASGLENYLTSVAGSSNPNHQLTNNFDNTSTFTAGTGSATISSLINTVGAEVLVFQFTATDLGPDNISTRFTQLTFKQAAGNQVADWSQLILGAELFDGTVGGTYPGSGGHGGFHDLATINATNIVIPNISAGNPPDLGSVAEASAKNYFLKIYLKPALGGSLPATIDNLHLEFSVTGSDIVPVGGHSVFAPASTTGSGPANDKVTVTATKIKINQQPSVAASANVALVQQPIFEATDANNNRDLDIGNAITVTTTNPTNLGPASAPTNFVSGLADFTGSGFNFTNVGTSTMAVGITTPTLTSPNSSAITVTASTDLGASALGMSASPLINSTTGVISGGTATNAVLGFKLQTTGSPLTLTQLIFTSSVSVTGLVQNFSLYSNTSDSFTGATLVTTSSSLTFSGLSVPLTGAPKYFYLVCDVDASFPSASPTISFSLPAGNFTVSAGGKTGSTQTGITYTLQDNTPPTVQSITIIPPPTTNAWSLTNGTSASTVTFRVTFSEPVSGIQYAGGNKNFTVQTVGTVGAASPSGAATASNFVDITITGVTGQGKLRVDFTEKDNIVDVAGNPIGGVGIGNGDFPTTFTTNKYYTIVPPEPAVEAITVNTGTITGNSIIVTWNGTATAPVPTHFLVLAKLTTGGSYPTVADGTYINDGPLAQNITYTLGTNTATFTGLNSGTSYDFIVYKYALGANTSNDNIDFETTTPGVKNAVVTNTAAVSWMTINTAAVPISSIMDNSGNSASVMSFKIYDDGLDPISPNVMTFHDNGLAPETIVFTLSSQLTLGNGASVTGFTSSSGSVGSAIYTGAGSTNTITLTSAADNQWTQATTISYSATTGNAQFITLGKMQSIVAHAVFPDQVLYTVPGGSSFIVPQGVTSITVETWGAGGSAGGYDASLYGAASQGGGGGAYSRSVIAVTPGTSYNVTVGAGGPSVVTNSCCTAGNPGGNSSFGPGLVLAQGGQGGENSGYFAYYGSQYNGSFSAGHFGLGGSAASGIGTVTFSGGNGGNGGSNIANDSGLGLYPYLFDIGGSGGSSAGTASNGFNGSGGFTGTCVSCTWGSSGAPAGGGAAGVGREGGAGFSGLFPGGGGGGTDFTSSGPGAGGQVKVSYSTAGMGTSDWAGDNSPFKFSQLVITQGPANNVALSNWQNIIAGAELSDGTNTVSGTINAANITFAAIPSAVATDVGFVPDATVGLSSKTYTLKVWLKNNLSNALAATVDGMNLDFKLDATIPANLTYDDVTNSAQKSSRLSSPAPTFNSGASQIQVVASKLVYNTAGIAPTNTNPQSQIGVGVPFSANVAGQDPEVYALDANNNLDLGYNNSGNITNTLSYGQSIASASFSSGKLSLNPFLFNTGSVTVANTQIVVTGTGVPVVSTATSTNVWPVISNLTTISAGTAPASELASFPSTTNSVPAAFNFDFVVTDDVGADGVGFTNNDALPTIIQTVTITQDPNNGINSGGDVGTFDDWTKTILGAQLTDVNTSASVSASSITGSTLVFNLPVTMQTVPDGGSQTYQLRIWLKNPVDPTLVDILDNKDFAFAINETNLFPLGGANTTSQMTASSTNTGDGRNVVTVTASEFDFVTQWLPAANQNYDAPLDADAVTVGVQSPAGKARDANGNLDLDFNAAVTLATQSPVLLPLANAAVGVSNGLLSFNPALQVTSAGGGADGATTKLVLTSGAITGLSNSIDLHYSNTSDIIRDNTFTYPTNILYASANNQVTDITAGTGTAMEQFTLRDGGASNDADGSPTKLTAITLNVTNWQNLRRLALYNGATEIQELDASAFTVTGDITFNSFVTPFVTPDNNNPSASNLTIKASFNGNGVIDNQIITFRIVSVAASAVSSSQFGTTTPVGIQSSVAGNQNKIEVVASQIIYTTVPATASINVAFTVVVQAQDANLNLDVDYNGASSIPGAHPNGNTSDYAVLNLPSGSFVGGILNYPAPPPNASGFQFTSGTSNTQLVINGGAANSGGASVDAGAITGTSSVISVLTSFDSWLYFDPTFTYTDQIDFVPFQSGATSSTSQALARVILSDGGAPGSTVSAGNPSPGTKNLALGSHDDTDGAPTTITDFTISLTNFADIKKIGLYTVGGAQIGSDQTPAATVTFASLNTQPAPDNDAIAYVIRAVFNSAIVDQHEITMQITAVTHNAGSNFPTNGTIAGVAGGDAPSAGHNFLNVIATSLDFTTQASSFAGINEPVGPTYTTPPLPSTSAAVVKARDKFQNLDDGAGTTGFNIPASSITITDNAADNIPSPAGFVNGVLNLDGMKYATPGDGTLKVVANGLDSSNPPPANTSAIPGTLVNVINVAATYNGVGVLGNGSPAPLSNPVSIKGGSLGQTIFGLTFTASGTTATEPKLQKFSISFDIPFSTSARTIFSNFVVREGATDVTGFGGNLTLLSSKGNSSLDSIVVDLSASPRSFDPTTHQLTYYLIADVDATANISTPPITPQFKDGGYLSLSDKNIVVSEGTGSGTFDGNVYSFASTKPPVLITAKNTAHPNQTSNPYNGQLNVSAALDSIHLRFDTKVISLDGAAELWNRSTNTKVANLIARNNPKGNFLVSGDNTTVDNPLRYQISFLPGKSFKADTVYYVTIKKGDFDPLASPPSGHGISDEGLNFYGGISSNSTLYFKISSDQPLVLSQPTGKIYNPSVGSISTVFDQFGTAYYLVLPTGSPAPASLNEVKTPSTYPTQSLIVASGNYTIDQINTLQTVTFPATDPIINPFVASQNYDVYIYAENDANPTPISSGGIYGSLANGFVAGLAGPTFKMKAPAAPVAGQPSYLICPGSFVTVSEPILLAEATISKFSAGTIIPFNPTLQDFNIVLPSGYEFDGVTFPDVQLIGADFNGSVATKAFVSNTVLKISYRNLGSSSLDYIVISNMKVIGAQGSAAQPILRFFGNNTSFTSPTAPVGTIGLFPSKTYNFNNSYSSDPNNIFPVGSPTFVDAIPDNYVDADPNIKGSVRLLPQINVAATHDYNASIFEGTGVTNDLLTLSAVPTNAAFNITMNHTDPNGCNTQVSQQYLVYDHVSPISKKLGTSNSVISLPGTAQALINTAFPNPSPSLVSSQTILDNELAGYELKSLSADIPASVLKGQTSQIMSGSDWATQIQKIPSVAGSVTNVFGTFFSYKWDYSHILNAKSEQGGTITKDPYFGDVNNKFDAPTGLGNTYWKGGSLGKVQFTGLFQSTADLSVYIPFRQNVELFVPAVPLVEVASANQSSYDAADGTVNTNGQTAYNYIKNTYSFQYTNVNGYQGTSVFCEQGGVITLNGYPAALAGTATGTFAIYDFQSYDFGGLKTGTITSQASSTAIIGTGTLFTTQLKVGSMLSDASGNFIGTVQSITDNLHLTLTAPAAITVPVANPVSYQAIFNTPLAAPLAGSAFVDNGNGSMTLDPVSIKNNYNDILVAYTYQENNSPAVGTGYIVIRVTPNPVAQFTIASTPASPGAPGASAFDKFCLGSLITFDASVAQAFMQANQQPSQGAYTTYISNYTWDFGDPNSGLPNSPATKNSVTGNITPGGAAGIAIQNKYRQDSLSAVVQIYDKPVHFYSVSSTYPVNLNLTSNWGCGSLPVIISNAASQTTYAGSRGNIIVGDIPIPDFQVAKNCVGDVITFDAVASKFPVATSGNSTIQNYNWDYNFQTPANTLPNPTPAVALLLVPTGANTIYAKDGFYNVQLTTITSLGCQASKTSIISQLAVKLPFNEYFDNASNPGGGWQTLDLNTTPTTPGSSWAPISASGRTNPVFDSPSSGNMFWTTSASTNGGTNGFYNPNEKSALYSPCLNLDPVLVPRPMISFSSFVDVATGDGLVLQYSNDDLNILDPAKSWSNLGTVSSGAYPGIDWFTNVGLPSNPGSNTSNAAGAGWSGNGNKWIHPKHALDILSSSTQKVILRFALSSVATSTVNTTAVNTGKPLDGVAIDSIFFGSRTRTILFENFTSTDGGTNSTLNSDIASDAAAITTFVQNTISQTQLVNINYHVGFVGQDPFNMDDPADPSSRALYYNVKKVPYAFLDGIHYQDQTNTHANPDLFQYWGQGEYDLNTLQLAKADFMDPGSNTKLTTVTTNADGSVQVDVNFTPVFDLPFGTRGGTVLQVAILEKVISPAPSYGKITTGETSFEYVLKKMLPNAAGTKFTSPILGIDPTGTTHPVSAGSFKWIPEKLHSNLLTIVVFLQNEDTKEVYQAFILDDYPAPTPVTEIQPLSADQIRVYPNPADQEFTIELPSPAQQKMKVTVANQLGQFTEVGDIEEGAQSKRISTQGLAEGVYILQLGSNGNALRTKIVVLHK